VKSYEALFPFLRPGQLLDGTPEHSLFRRFWSLSRPDSFNPPDSIAALRQTKLR
jgi:hypothetical protein